MSAEELLLWMARSRESPIGLDREDFHAAQVAAAMGGGKIVDHLPQWGQAASDDADGVLDRFMAG